MCSYWWDSKAAQSIEEQEAAQFLIMGPPPWWFYLILITSRRPHLHTRQLDHFFSYTVNITKLKYTCPNVTLICRAFCIAPVNTSGHRGKWSPEEKLAPRIPEP